MHLLSARYNLNIVESGVKHHALTPLRAAKHLNELIIVES